MRDSSKPWRLILREAPREFRNLASWRNLSADSKLRGLRRSLSAAAVRPGTPGRWLSWTSFRLRGPSEPTLEVREPRVVEEARERRRQLLA